MAARKTQTATPAPAAPSTAAGGPAPALRITAERDGLYCCGVSHPAHPVRYSAGWFTAAQLRELRAHPALRVEEL